MTRLSATWAKGLQFYRRLGDARWAFGSQVLISGANVLTTVILARMLGLNLFGQFSLCFVLIMSLRSFANGVVLLPMATLGPKLSPRLGRVYRSVSLGVAMGFAVVSSALLWLALEPLGRVMKAEWLMTLATPLAVANLLCTAAEIVRRYHFVYERPGVGFTLDVVRYGLQLVLLGGLALMRPAWPLVDASLYLVGVSALIAAGLGWTVIGDLGWNNYQALLLWRRQLKFMRWITPNMIMEAIHINVPVFMASAILGEVAATVLRAGQVATSVVNLPIYALQQVLPSAASRLARQSGTAALTRRLIMIGVAGVGAILLVTIGLWMFAPWLFKLIIGAEILDPRAVMLGFGLLSAANLASIVVSTWMYTVGNVRAPTVATFCALALVLLACRPAIMALGVVAVPLLGIVYWATLTAVTVLSHRYLRLNRRG